MLLCSSKGITVVGVPPRIMRKKKQKFRAHATSPVLGRSGQIAWKKETKRKLGVHVKKLDKSRQIEVYRRNRSRGDREVLLLARHHV